MSHNIVFFKINNLKTGMHFKQYYFCLPKKEEHCPKNLKTCGTTHMRNIFTNEEVLVSQALESIQLSFPFSSLQFKY